MKNYCNICNSSNNINIYRGIIKCKTCTHCFADISIDHYELKKIYKKNYFFGEEYLNYQNDKNIIIKNFNLRLNKLKKYFNFNDKSLLEIGSAYGYFLDLIKNDFKHVSGVEISEDCLNFCAENYNFKTYDFLEFENKLNNKYDIFCLWDVIEHLQDPNKYLNKINELSNKGAIITLTTGNIESMNAKIFKENWRLIHPPTHLHYFSPKSIEEILNRNNFKIIHFEHCGYYRSIDFILYKLKLKKYFNFFLKNSKIKLPSLYLNMYDIMYVIAQKI